MATIAKTMYLFFRAFAYGVGWLLGSLPFRNQRIAALQLRVVLKRSDAGVIARRTFAELARTTLECIMITATRRYSPIDVSSLSALATSLDAKRPVIALSGHVGNWELLAAQCAEVLGRPIRVVATPARGSAAQRLLVWIRRRAGVATLWRNGPGSARTLIRSVRNGEVIGVLIDQDTRVDSVWATFLGRQVRTPISICEFGSRYDAQFISIFMVRRGDAFCIKAQALPDISRGKCTMAEVIQLYHARLEEIVREAPEQWVWVHKRWRSRPDGTQMSSAEYERALRAELHTISSRA